MLLQHVVKQLLWQGHNTVFGQRREMLRCSMTRVFFFCEVLMGIFGVYVPLCVSVKCFDAEFELANIRARK